jgi:HD-like signal output (HDOD) protein/prolyl-tRNA editing enzyme YbaK/EbsC (Cys-tRNA(Pro) deacylase)
LAIDLHSKENSFDHKISKEPVVSVPSNIARLLEDNEVPYSVTEVTRNQTQGVVQLKAYNTTRATVLSDSNKNKLIAITRSDTLLDIKAINELFNTQFTPLSDDALKRFMENSGVNAIPALPGMNNLPTVVDEGLLEFDSVYVDIGVGKQYIQLEKKHFQQLLGNTKVAHIVTPLSNLEIPTNVDNDRKDIEYSVSLFTERRIKDRLEETLEFPPLPVTAERIIKLRVNPHADISDLTDIVELDASLSAQVVSWAASPYYSAPGSIKSIHDAIVRVLGFDMVLNLALGLALGNTLKMPEKGPHGCLGYWEQSVYTAAATEALVTCIPRENRPSFGTAYLAGLLNNFGHLIIAEVFNNQFQSIINHIDANPQASFTAVEKHVIGVDRNQLASWLMGYWHMPETICNALRHQGDPEYSGDDWEYSLLLYLANKLLQERGLMMGASNEEIDESVYKRLNIDPNAAAEAIENLLESSEELQAMAKQMSG